MREVYAQAENAYRIGRIEQAREMLLQNLSTLQGNSRQSALRLIALTYMDDYDIPKAEQYVTLLLEQNPYYTPSSNDPATFVEIVNHIKAGMTPTITTASNQAETLAEVPVPTTLITEEMIQTSGARNLQEVLAAYVPGMNLIDCNDDINIAMRGIYSNTQEKILIMLNGHRLNSYATNTAAPDFSISLEKVKQIEVLRGPASSLYGGVALTGVVNIITKQGIEVDGRQATMVRSRSMPSSANAISTSICSYGVVAIVTAANGMATSSSVWVASAIISTTTSDCRLAGKGFCSCTIRISHKRWRLTP